MVSLPYDIKKIVSAFETSGIYEKGFCWSQAVVKLLQTGDNYPEKWVKRAQALAAEHGYDFSNLPERFCEQAAREIGIESFI